VLCVINTGWHVALSSSDMCQVVIGTTRSIKVQIHMTHGMPKGDPCHPTIIIMPHQIHYFRTSGLCGFIASGLWAFGASRLWDFRGFHICTPQNYWTMNIWILPFHLRWCHHIMSLRHYGTSGISSSHSIMKNFFQSIKSPDYCICCRMSSMINGQGRL